MCNSRRFNSRREVLPPSSFLWDRNFVDIVQPSVVPWTSEEMSSGSRWRFRWQRRTGMVRNSKRNSLSLRIVYSIAFVKPLLRPVYMFTVSAATVDSDGNGNRLWDIFLQPGMTCSNSSMWRLLSRRAWGCTHPFQCSVAAWTSRMTLQGN